MAYMVGKKGASSLFKTSFKATAGQTSASFTQTLNPSLLKVYRNGVLLYSTDYTVAGSSVTFTQPLDANDEITIENVGTTVALADYGSIVVDTFTGDGVKTQFDLSFNPGSTTSLDVAISGVTQTPDVDYSWDGNGKVVFVTAPVSGVSILVRYSEAYPVGVIDVSGVKKNGESLDGPFGSSMIGLATYGDIRSYTGSANIIRVGGRQNIFDHGHGTFVRTGTSADDDGYVLRDGLNRSWVRQVEAGTFGDPRWYGLSLTASDNTPFIRATLNAVKTCYLPAGEWPITTQLRVLKNEQLLGDPERSVLLINNAAIGAIITHDGTLNNTQPNVVIRGIRIKGTALYGFGFTHCTQSNFSQLSVDGLTCTNGYIFEYFWNSHFSDLKSNGATISDAPFLFNKVVLNSEFDALYSSNFSNYTLRVDSTVAQISNSNVSGFGGLIFRNLACQGANKYGIYIKQGIGITFEGGYTENCLGAIRIDNAQRITFNQCGLVGTRSGVSTHDMWIGASAGTTSRITFNQCDFGTLESIFDSFSSAIAFNQPAVTGNGKFFDKVRRTSATPSSMPISVYGNGGTSTTFNVLKTNNLAWKFVEQSISDTGTFTNTVITPSTSSITVPY